MDKYKIYEGQKFYLQSSGRYYQSGRKTDSERLLHRRVWSDVNGPIPDRHEIHHINGDWTNNNIDNLECIDCSVHRREHMLERFADPAYREQNKSQLQSVQHLAAQGRDNPETRKKLSDAAKKSWERSPVAKSCEACDAEYETYFPSRSKYCSSACQQRVWYHSKKRTGSLR